MYQLQCPGGFSMPAKAGKFEVVGICVTVSNSASDSQFAIVDDPNINSTTVGRTLSTLTEQKGIIANIKGLANVDTVLAFVFNEPIKTRYGLSIRAVNTLPGSICVYVR